LADQSTIVNERSSDEEQQLNTPPVETPIPENIGELQEERQPDASAVVAAPSRSMLETGVASWYGARHHGRRTASGEIFDQKKLTAAHPSLPWGCIVKVTSLANGKSVNVRINDRGPFVKGRIIDLSRAAARALGMDGVMQVQLEVLTPSETADNREIIGDEQRQATARPANQN
jgi:rare lipoprotein A